MGGLPKRPKDKNKKNKKAVDKKPTPQPASGPEVKTTEELRTTPPVRTGLSDEPLLREKKRLESMGWENWIRLTRALDGFKKTMLTSKEKALTPPKSFTEAYSVQHSAMRSSYVAFEAFSRMPTLIGGYYPSKWGKVTEHADTFLDLVKMLTVNHCLNVLHEMKDVRDSVRIGFLADRDGDALYSDKDGMVIVHEKPYKGIEGRWSIDDGEPHRSMLEELEQGVYLMPPRGAVEIGFIQTTAVKKALLKARAGYKLNAADVDLVAHVGMLHNLLRRVIEKYGDRAIAICPNRPSFWGVLDIHDFHMISGEMEPGSKDPRFGEKGRTTESQDYGAVKYFVRFPKGRPAVQRDEEAEISAPMRAKIREETGALERRSPGLAAFMADFPPLLAGDAVYERYLKRQQKDKETEDALERQAAAAARACTTISASDSTSDSDPEPGM